MHLEILTPERTFYSGQAQSVSLPGNEGRFQVLDKHAPLIASLKAGLLRFTAPSGEVRLQVGGGVVEVLQNKVTVLVETAESDDKVA